MSERRGTRGAAHDHNNLSTDELEVFDDEHVDEAVRVLKLLADPTRLRLLHALLHGDHGVGELADHVNARPAAVSQHLAKLRWAGLVVGRRVGTRVLYRASDPHVEGLVAEALRPARRSLPTTTSEVGEWRSRSPGGRGAMGRGS
jgi:DNA-binding transcriptional ArsR family regulator